MTARSTPDPDPRSAGLLPLRTALIVTIALLIGLAVGVLTYLTSAGIAAALQAGLCGAGAAVLPLDRVIGR